MMGVLPARGPEHLGGLHEVKRKELQMPDERRPNIVLIMADDMGYSDIGCYGSDIRTPTLNGLAENGLRFSQMYNYARCCPSRASLLTGLSPHKASIGHMVADLDHDGYRGFLSEDSVTVAEALGESGYNTLMSGKWHVGGNYDLQHPESWRAGDPGHPTPRQRGFDDFYGTLIGAGSFFNPLTLYKNEEPEEPDSLDFYYTDAIAENAVRMIDENAPKDPPFFLYVAFTSPHWPLHAPEEEISRYEGKYRDGWDAVRTGRHEELNSLGILDETWEITPRDDQAPPWEEVPDQEWEDLRMAVYAAQIDRMDQGIGKIMAALKAHGVSDNTLVMFLSDNGGCAEFLAEDSARPQPAQFNTPTLDGSEMRFGNVPGLRPGPGNTFMSYDLPWSNASNAPFRLYKHWVHEGGISTPFIVHWPDRLGGSAIVHDPVHIMDIMATCLDAAGAPYPTEREGHGVAPLEGTSMLSLFDGNGPDRQSPVFWEHEGNKAVREGEWKLVCKFPGDWELYNMAEDRTELHDRAGDDPKRVEKMASEYRGWAERSGVQPWPVPPFQPEQAKSRGKEKGHPTIGPNAHIVGG